MACWMKLEMMLKMRAEDIGNDVKDNVEDMEKDAKDANDREAAEDAR